LPARFVGFRGPKVLIIDQICDHYRCHAIESIINRYYDPTTGMFVSVDPDVALTGHSYAYAGDDPVNEVDPLGLCNNPNQIGYYPGACATTAAESLAAGAYIQSHSGGGGWSLSNATKAVADYGAGVSDFVVSTATLGQVHVSDPYCGFGWAYGVGYGYGAVGTAALGLGEADGATLEGEVANISADDAATNSVATTQSTPMSQLDRVGSGLKNDVYHRATSWVVDEPTAVPETITGGDGNVYTSYTLDGEVNGVGGQFNWIVDANGDSPVITHQLFTPDK
jgi:hypothetical protein